MPHNLGDAASLATVVLAMFGGLGAFYKFVLLPNLREQLFKPVQETNRQVTANGGRNDPPTVPDKLHALQDSVDVLTTSVTDLASKYDATAKLAEKAAEAAQTAAAEATKQRNEIDLAQTVLLEHIKGHTHDE